MVEQPAQFDKISHKIERAASRDDDEWIRVENVRPACRKELFLVFFRDDIHPFFTPGDVKSKQVKFLSEQGMIWMGYADTSLLTVAIRCNRQ